jgi:hypothetical protein
MNSSGLPEPALDHRTSLPPFDEDDNTVAAFVLWVVSGIPLYERALAISEKALGAEHPFNKNHPRKLGRVR